MNFLNHSEPYFGRDPAEHAKSLPLITQQKAWADHRAWTAVDYIGDCEDISQKYGVLARLVAEMLDANCTGVYVPGESSLMPDDPSIYGHSLYEALRKLGASYDPGIRENGE